jgi:hypothetical protein
MRIVSRHSFCRTRAPHVRSNALLPKGSGALSVNIGIYLEACLARYAPAILPPLTSLGQVRHGT